jgi:hypothetical protein
LSLAPPRRWPSVYWWKTDIRVAASRLMVGCRCHSADGSSGDRALRRGARRTLAAMSGADVTSRDTAAEPFLGSQPQDMRPDLVIPDVWPRDEKLWVPLSDGVWSRPRHFNAP